MIFFLFASFSTPCIRVFSRAYFSPACTQLKTALEVELKQSPRTLIIPQCKRVPFQGIKQQKKFLTSVSRLFRLSEQAAAPTTPTLIPLFSYHFRYTVYIRVYTERSRKSEFDFL